MSQVIFSKNLVDQIGQLGDVMSSFLEEQVEAIQSRLKEKYPKAKEDTAWKTISAFSTLEGTKIPMDKEEVYEKLSYPNSQVDLVLGLFEQARILRLADGIYEIAHDTLALQISEKRSGEEKGLLEVQKLVVDRHIAYLKTGTLLSKKEIDFVSPFENRIDITDDQHDFIAKSRKQVKRKQLLLWSSIIAAFAIISLFAIFAFIKANEATEQAQIAFKERENALKARNEADSAKNEAIKAKDEAILAKNEADTAKNKAIIAQNEAETAKNTAILAKNDAEKQKKKAEDERKKAKIAEDDALIAKKEAESQRDTANAQKVIADTAKVRAERSQKNAIKQREIAVKKTEIARDLQINALSSALAIKSSKMKYQPRLKGLLAMLAFNLHGRTGEELVSPDVFNGLYKAVQQYAQDDFDQITDEHRGAVRSLIINKGKMFTSSSDGKLIKWKLKSTPFIGKPISVKEQTFEDRKENVDLTMVQSPNLKWLATGGKKSDIELINLADNNKSRSIELHQGDVYDLEFTPDNKYIISIGSDKKIIKYDIEANKIIKEFTIPLMFQTEEISIHPDGKILAVGNSLGQLQFFDLSSNNKTPTSNIKMAASISALAFDKFTKRLAVGLTSGAVSLITPQEGNYTKDGIKSRKNHGQQISCIAFKQYRDVKTFEPTTNVMAIGSLDGTASVWNIDQFRNELYEPLFLEDDETWVMSLDFTRGGKQLAVGYLDGKIRFWPLFSDKVAENLCEQIGQKQFKMNVNEVEQYLGHGIQASHEKDYCKNITK